MKETTSTVIGFAVAALPIAIVFALTSPGLGGGIDGDLVNFLVLTAMGYIYSVFFVAVLALPLFLLLRRFNLVRWWSSSMAGLAIGVIVAKLLFPRSTDVIELWTLLGGTGVCSGFIFWSIWRNGIP